MFVNKTVVCVIPARLSSSRFPNKMLALLQGKPLVQWAWEGAINVPFFDRVMVAVDGQELKEIVQKFGGEALLTSPECANGTERLIELQEQGKIEGDIWVNWQGDEPFITKKILKTLLQSCEDPTQDVWTLKRRIEKKEEIDSPHVVKVVTDHRGKALYFSRHPIPYGEKQCYKHVGLYAFSEDALKKISTFSPCFIEQQERLEQLRFLYHGMHIQVHETTEEIFGIDTKEELAMAEKMCYPLHDVRNKIRL